MPKGNNTSLFDESRIYEEDGEVKVRHIIHDSPITDMTPHPTEKRVFIMDGEVIEILSEDSQKNDAMSLEMSRTLLHETMRLAYLMKGLSY